MIIEARLVVDECNRPDIGERGRFSSSGVVDAEVALVGKRRSSAHLMLMKQGSE
jgi:hypothetical protein